MEELKAIEQMKQEIVDKYLHEHQDTASEVFDKTMDLKHLQWDTALEACNKERKEYRDLYDLACANGAKYESQIAGLKEELKEIDELLERLMNPHLSFNGLREIKDDYQNLKK